MQIIDGARFPEFDPTPFVGYQTAEDLAPTTRELVEELPEYELPPAMKAIAEGKPLEKPLRRGIGYLRAESAPEVTGNDSEEDTHSDFGEGLEQDPPTTETETGAESSISAAPSNAIREAESTNSGSGATVEESPGRKKRRRPRRRRGKRDITDKPATHTDRSISTGAQPGTNSSETPSFESASDVSNGASSKAASDSQKPKRNRRRRRRKRGGDSAAGPGAE